MENIELIITGTVPLVGFKGGKSGERKVSNWSI
jgi:hypothetical protein